MNSALIERTINVCEIIIITSILLLAFSVQFILHELPCPLCLLQRIGFIFIAYGFLLNLKFGFKPTNYAIVILSGLFTSFVALRQVALHIIPGSGHYGSALFGWHLYTWSFVFAMGITILTTLTLMIERPSTLRKLSKPWHYLCNAIFMLFLALVALNAITVFLQCGYQSCPDNPVSYRLT